MKTPRDISGSQLAGKLKSFGYKMTRQTGSHMRLTTLESGEHHITIPKHGVLRTGTLTAVLKDVAQHFHLSREDLIVQLFGKK
ncbi:type II toxin-antitoxin system HicA family toxin [Desulfonema magnum]|uniref:Toxin-antitoxin system, toxin component, HicA-like n=1 Tax=Desulfonema magnum TaxID=45655 RepID=A0A975BMC0_9BACT|nr:type II toxin-antitoxin system HicA family toxin [Desulfonema magnum]QTA87639.1 Toxin-antitoxin system, toxin component, HicA-like [Desulfonema magnum]